LLTAMLAVVAGGFHPTDVAAQAPAEGSTGSRSTRIELSPSPLALRCGEAADLSVRVSDVVALWGVDFQLAYDPALLEVVDGERSAQGQALISEVFSGSQAMIALNGVDPAAGVASFAAVLLRPAEPLQGEVEVARVRLRGRAAGAGEILLRAATLADPQARPIPVTTSPVLFEVLCPSASAGDADAESGLAPRGDAVDGAEGVDEDDQARRADGVQGENVEAEEDEQAQMMLYLVIGMLAAVSAGVAGIAGAIAVARRMVPLAPEEKSRDEKPARDE
jgi:hypothetical protein